MIPVFFVLVSLVLTVDKANSAQDNCPAVFERYCEHHSYCLPANSSCEVLAYYPTNDDIADIVKYHNKYRNMIALGNQGLPAASNMLEMVWDNELAGVAQKYADQCLYKHDPSNCRRVMNFGVGQNLAIQTLTGGHTAPQPDWNFAVDIWFSEIIYFQKQDICPFHAPDGAEYRHFSQLTWAKTFRVGCGYVLYKTGDTLADQTLTRLYVCNYGPTGNVYEECVWEQGTACSNCPINSCCGNSCGPGRDFTGLCKLNANEPANYPPPPSNLFYCNFQDQQSACDNYVNGQSNWEIEPALGGNYLEIVLNGGENSTISFKNMIQPISSSFCISLEYRKGPNVAGQENANQASEILSVPDLSYTHSQPLMDYSDAQRHMFSTYNLTLSWDQKTQFQLNFNVPPGKPAQFFNVKSILATDGKCQNKS